MKMVYLISIILFGCFPVVYAQQNAFLTSEEILSEWEKNYSSIPSLEVEFIERVLSAVPLREEDQERMQGIPKYEKFHRIEQQGKFYCSYTHPLRDDPNKFMLTNFSFDGIEFRVCKPDDKSGLIYQQVYKHSPANSNKIGEYLLSASDSSGVQYFKQLFESSEIIEDRILNVRPFLEEVNGQKCHVVELSDEEGVIYIIIWVAHEKGMLPMKYQDYGYEGKEIQFGFEVLEIALGSSEKSSLWYPKKAQRVMNLPSIGGKVTFEIEVSKFIPNPAIDPNIFKLEFPVGTTVMDDRIKESYKVGID